MNELEQLWQDEYCWHIGCTTCGCGPLRKGMRRLAGEDDVGVFTVPISLTGQARLLRLAREVDYARLNEAQPRWLGYLGLLLMECEEVERESLILTPTLRQQIRSLRDIGKTSCHRDEWLQGEGPLTWHALQNVEDMLRAHGVLKGVTPW